MNQLTQFKEAIKTALALAIVFAIALKAGWMNPAWAGWSVAMISLATAGQSIRKGLLRLGGTIPGCVAALVIMSIAPQDRWLFLLLTCCWIFVTTYMMLVDARHSYFWFVSGFVCLIILLTGPSSPENLFQHAAFRTVETAMGVVVYTLISVFLWPNTNAGAIRKASTALASTQASLIVAGRRLMLGEETGDPISDLRTKEIQQLTGLAEALDAEAAESYTVLELRPLWDSFHNLSSAMAETLDRWLTDSTDPGRLNFAETVPNLEEFFSEIDRRFEAIQKLLAESPTDFEPTDISLEIDRAAGAGFSALDRAALALLKKETEVVESLSRDLYTCARDLGESAQGRVRRIQAPQQRRETIPDFLVPDTDHLRGAMFAVATVATGFLIWIFVNPPGHSAWFQFPAITAMSITQMQQVRTTVFVKPVAVALGLGLAVYVLVMPRLTDYLELGVVIFVCMFINCFFFSGIARLAGSIGILSMIAVQNQQTYDFASMANSAIFNIMGFLLVFVMSYLLRSPRPEKAVLSLMRRFFRSAQYLVSGARAKSFPGRWVEAYHRKQLKSLPAKISGWCKAIDQKKFPANQPQQVQALVTSLQAIVNRVDQLLETGQGSERADFVNDELHASLQNWQQEISQTFGQWAENPAPREDEKLRLDFADWSRKTGGQMTEIARRSGGKIDEEQGEQFLRLVGGYRGISEAALAYAGPAHEINWSHWREERF